MEHKTVDACAFSHLATSRSHAQELNAIHEAEHPVQLSMPD